MINDPSLQSYQAINPVSCLHWEGNFTLLCDYKAAKFRRKVETDPMRQY